MTTTPTKAEVIRDWMARYPDRAKAAESDSQMARQIAADCDAPIKAIDVTMMRSRWPKTVEIPAELRDLVSRRDDDSSSNEPRSLDEVMRRRDEVVPFLPTTPEADHVDGSQRDWQATAAAIQILAAVRGDAAAAIEIVEAAKRCEAADITSVSKLLA